VLRVKRQLHSRVSDAAGCRGRSPADHEPPIGARFFSSCGEARGRSGAAVEEANPFASPRLGSITSRAPPSSLPRRQSAVTAAAKARSGQNKGLAMLGVRERLGREGVEAVGYRVSNVPVPRWSGNPPVPSKTLDTVRLITSYSFLGARRVDIPGLSTLKLCRSASTTSQDDCDSPETSPGGCGSRRASGGSWLTRDGPFHAAAADTLVGIAWRQVRDALVRSEVQGTAVRV
jgi:hypothetical protein